MFSPPSSSCRFPTPQAEELVSLRSRVTEADSRCQAWQQAVATGLRELELKIAEITRLEQLRSKEQAELAQLKK